MKRFAVIPIVLFLIILSLHVQVCVGAPSSKTSVIVMSNGNAKLIAGNASWLHEKRAVSIKGELLGDFAVINNGIRDGGWVTFDIRGWDVFKTELGIRDGSHDEAIDVDFEVDGDSVKSISARRGEKVIPILINLHDRKTLTLRVDGDAVFCEPRLVKGKVSVQSVTSPKSVTKISQTPSTNVLRSSAGFVVDPKDLESLAKGLHRRMDANPVLRARVNKGEVAVMTFSLVDISSKSVATNVVEDLSTSMINEGFNLVERGQLDKVFKELKIQDSGLVNPATAKKIGALSGCDLILLGSISDRGQFVVINARLMETATGKSLAAERVEMRKIPIPKGE